MSRSRARDRTVEAVLASRGRSFYLTPLERAPRVRRAACAAGRDRTLEHRCRSSARRLAGTSCARIAACARGRTRSRPPVTRPCASISREPATAAGRRAIPIGSPPGREAVAAAADWLRGDAGVRADRGGRHRARRMLACGRSPAGPRSTISSSGRCLPAGACWCARCAPSPRWRPASTGEDQVRRPSTTDGALEVAGFVLSARDGRRARAARPDGAGAPARRAPARAAARTRHARARPPPA